MKGAKILIITVAGLSSRFSESLGYPCLKCLYHENGIEESLLYRMLHLTEHFDYYIVVGGFMYDELESVLENYFKELRSKILLIRNEHYADYGSGYSLYLALEKIQRMDHGEVVFAEGDLYVDAESFRRICDSSANVITCSREEILASKAVAYYFDCSHRIHYIYDTAHGALEIREPFLGIFNSGQIWKFADMEHLRQTFGTISEQDWHGTNLVFIQKYFGELARESYEIVTFEQWINCNTVSDFRRIAGRKAACNEDTG